MKLKLYLLIIFMVVQISSGFGQGFAPIGSEWYYSSSGGGMAPTGAEYYYLKVVKDTLINNWNLRKIERTYYNYQGDSVEVSPYFIYELGDTVWLYDQNVAKLYKLFVFNAVQGDTLELDIPYSWASNDTTYHVVIDSIDTVEVDNTFLRRYHLNQLDNFGWFNGYYLEKVGGYEWFLPLGLTVLPEANGPIRCYHDSQIDVNFTTNACDYWLINSSSDLSNVTIELYPNPASNYINVKGKMEINHMELVDISGRDLLSSKSPNMDVSNLPKGAYIVRVYGNNQVIIRKLLKK